MKGPACSGAVPREEVAAADLPRPRAEGGARGATPPGPVGPWLFERRRTIGRRQVRAYTAYRTRLAAEYDQVWAAPAPAFVGIDRWGHITGGMVPDSVTRAVTRISTRAGVPVAWTGHSLGIGLAAPRRSWRGAFDT